MNFKGILLLAATFISTITFAQVPVIDGAERVQVIDGDTVWSPTVDALKAFIGSGGGADTQNISIDGTDLSLVDGGSIKLDTILQNIAKSNSIVNDFSLDKAGFRDYFKQTYYQDTTTNYDWVSTGVRISCTTADAANNRFKVNWKQLPKIISEGGYDPGYVTDTRHLKWWAYYIEGEDIIQIDSVDIQNGWMYYTPIFGGEPATSQNWDFYCPMLNGITADPDTLLYDQFPFDIGSTYDGSNVHYYDPGGIVVRSDGSWVQFIYIRENTGTASRNIYAFISHDEGKTWESFANDESAILYPTDLSGAYTELTNGIATPLVDTPYIGKILVTFSAIDATSMDPFYMILNEDLSNYVPATEIPMSVPSYTSRYRMTNINKIRGKYYVVGCTDDGTITENDPEIIWQFASLTDYFNGNPTSHDTLAIWSVESGIINGLSDNVYSVVVDDELWVVPNVRSNLSTNSLNANRSFFAFPYDLDADTAKLNEVYPILTAMLQAGYTNTDIGDAWSDHMGGYVNFMKHNNSIYMSYGIKGENTGTDYYRTMTQRVFPKTKGLGGMDIADGSIKAKHLAQDVTGEQITMVELASGATDWNVYLKRNQQGYYPVDASEPSGTVQINLHNPAFIGNPVYVFHFRDVTDVDFTWPSNAYDQTETLMGTVNYLASTIVTCLYSINDKKFYCK